MVYGFMQSNKLEDDYVSRKKSTGRSALRRRSFLSILGAGVLTSTAAPGVSAQEDEEEEGREPDIRDLMVETRDNVELATDVYLPSESGTFPTIVYRTPYDKDDQLVRPSDEGEHRYLAALLENGYAIVKQDVRGRFKSEGEWNPVFFDQEDGYDTVEWAADQDWSTGRVGMLGGSFRAFTSWQAALADPPSLEAIAPIMSPANFYRGWQFKGGAFELGVNIAWTLGNNNIPRLPISEEEKDELRADMQDPMELYEYLPVNENPAFDDFVAPYYFDWLLYDRYHEYWERIDVNKHIENVSAKVLTVGGFYDIFLEGHPAAFNSIAERGQQEVADTQSMILGPWVHRRPSSDPIGDRDLPERAGTVGDPADLVRWFNQWLKKGKSGGENGRSSSNSGSENGRSSSNSGGDKGKSGESFPPVQYYQTRAEAMDDEWRTASTWPPEGTATQTMYLNSEGDANSRNGGGTLSTEEPTDGADTDSYIYDPLDPTPTTGGPILQVGAESGVKDQREVEDRDDVLVFTSEELDEPLDVVGIPEVTLFVESTAPDTDFGVKLVDVEPDGYAANITESYLRARYRETSTGESYREGEFMEPGNVYELSIDLRSVAHTFEKGHRIRLDITSSNFPRIDRNPNHAMDVDSATEEDMLLAANRIHHHADRPTHVLLPILEEYVP